MICCILFCVARISLYRTHFNPGSGSANLHLPSKNFVLFLTHSSAIVLPSNG